MQCIYKFNDNRQCGAFAMNQSQFCINHNPEAKELKRLAVLKGGRSPKKREVLLPAIPILNKQDIAPFLTSIIEEVREGKIDIKKANALGYITGILIKAYELLETEERIEKIEKIVFERRILNR